MASIQILRLNDPMDFWIFLDTCRNAVIQSDSFRRIIEYLLGYLDCQIAVIEHEYIDIDYRNEFSNLYSKTFSKYDSRTKRLHFFKGTMLGEDDLSNPDADCPSYLGFMVLRPLNVGTVGRTVICPDARLKGQLYPLCTSEHVSHLLARDFTVVGSPFISQDTMVMSCAQSSLWMAALYMHKSFGFPRFLPYEITESASRSLGWFGRTIPATSGLTCFQMINALTNMGFSPLLYSKPSGGVLQSCWDPAALIYGYVESRIPVILGVPGHAVLVVGHLFDSDPGHCDRRRASSPTAGPFTNSSSHTNAFLVNDEGIGPYRVLPVDANDRTDLSSMVDLFPDSGGCYNLVDDIEVFLVPLPEKIYLLYEDAQSIAESFLNQRLLWRALIESSRRGNSDATVLLDYITGNAQEQANIVVRCHFVDSSTYKRAVSTADMSPTLKQEYLDLPMSHYIWIAEVTTRDLFCRDGHDSRQVLGELLIDTTVNKYDIERACLSIHLPGFLFTRNHTSGAFNKLVVITDDHPYALVDR